MRERGDTHYDEAVTQLQHALQCAQLARQRGMGDGAVTAALFHDIGHLLLDEHDSQQEFLERDLNHEAAGANLLKQWFPDDVTAPIRLHVVAKRYLCSTEPDYHDQLSEASQRSFRLQGGPLADDERRALEQHPGLELAVALRRLDDLGKSTSCETPPIEAFCDSVVASLRREYG